MKPSFEWRRLGVWSGLVMLASPFATRPGNGWPVMAPAHAEYVFIAPQQQNPDTPFIVYFKDQQGSPVYKFECHSGVYADNTELTFSGDFQCALFPFKGETVSDFNLLAADTKREQSKDWWNRGRVLARQFRGECLDYPEYSTLRHFRLRGMALTLTFTDIQWNPAQAAQDPALAKFTLAVDVVPDKDALTPMAAVPTDSSPPKSCYP